MDLKILGKTICVKYEDGVYKFDDICYRDKMERDVVWRIYVDGNLIYREMCIQEGKVRVFDPIESIGKNIGKKNETTDCEQAILESWAMWKKKKDSVKDVIFPMLAQDYRKHSSKIIFPCGVSEKIDGIRALAENVLDEIQISSRQSKPFTFLERIKQDIRLICNKFPGIVFDGEIYSHEICFSRISGAVRKTTSKPADDDLLEYWIFDIINPGPYTDRMKLLKQIEKYYKKWESHNSLRFVYYKEVVSKEEVNWWHREYVKKGFEGVICRNLDSIYMQKFRSYDLQKYKDFEDNEFKIVGVKDGKGSEMGAALFVCECGKKTFDVRPRGSIDRRRDMWKHKDLYIGKMLTVRYQNTGIQVGELPRFPVGIDVRDYE